MLQTQIEGGERKMTQVFVSYHFTAKNGKMNGFGNYVGAFNQEEYKNELGKFILDLEETISKLLKEKLKMEVGVKIMNFK